VKKIDHQRVTAAIERTHNARIAILTERSDLLQEDVEALRRQVRELEDRLTAKSDELYDYQQFVIQRYGAAHEGEGQP
jgi:chaperonin cofactor prefoldin